MAEAFEQEMRQDLRESMLKEAKDIAKTPAQKAELLADIVGIFDPTPTSDAIGTALALSRGDLFGAGISLFSMVPYVGDAIGKPAKFLRHSKKLGNLAELIFKKSDELAKSGELLAKHVGLDKVAAARERAMARVKKAMQNKAANNCTADCAKLTAKGATKGKITMPGASKRADGNIGGKTGYWKDGIRTKNGESTFKLDNPIDGPNGPITEVKFVDGFPVFDDHALKFPGTDIPLKTHIGKYTGSAATDGNTAMKQLMADNPGMTRPNTKGYTWHHKENGEMILVPTDLNGKVSHSGGASMFETDLY